MNLIKNLFDFCYLRYHGVHTRFGYVTLNGLPFITKCKDAKIVIGKGVTLNSSFKSNIAGINHPVVLAAIGKYSVINISDGCGISGATVVSVKSITLEFGVGLGANSSVYDTDFHPIGFEQRKLQKSIEDAKSEEILIGEGTLIGANSIVLKGSIIGKRCVIGAGSVVAKNIPDDTLAAGNPVRIIRGIEKE